MKAFYMASDHLINAAIVTFNWIALGDIGKIVGIIVGLTWIVKNLIDIYRKCKKK